MNKRMFAIMIGSIAIGMSINQTAKDEQNYAHLVHDGLSFRYYDHEVRQVAHALKRSDFWAIQEAGNFLSRQVKEDDIIVPMPSRNGIAKDTLLLAEYISDRTGAKVADCLRSKPRPSVYQTKKSGKNPQSIELDFKMTCHIDPTRHKVFILDNVIGTGYTMNQARKIIPFAQPLVYAVDI